MTDTRLTIETRFGSFEVQERDVVTFPRGIPGFETTRRFVLLSHETLSPLRCLHGIDGTTPSFLAVDPRTVMGTYAVTLRPEELAQIDAEPDAPLVWLVLVTFGNTQDVPTANLRAPIVINPRAMRGCQFVIDDERYPVRHTLAA